MSDDLRYDSCSWSWPFALQQPRFLARFSFSYALFLKTKIKNKIMNIIDSKEENHVIDSFAHLCSRFAPHPRDLFLSHNRCSICPNCRWPCTLAFGLSFDALSLLLFLFFIWRKKTLVSIRLHSFTPFYHNSEMSDDSRYHWWFVSDLLATCSLFVSDLLATC
jgi:hypothetical protein